ncbi:MAG: hypothetical protein ABIA77_00240, partial [Candidatus Omnitrophota bacterium]
MVKLSIKPKKLYLIIGGGLACAVLLLLLITLPMKETQFFLLRTENRPRSLETKIINYETFVKKNPSFIPARLKLAEFYTQLGSNPDNADKTEHIAKAIEHYRSIL